MWYFPFIQNFRKCKLIYSDNKHNSGCLEKGIVGGMDSKGAQGNLRITLMATFLITVTISEVYACQNSNFIL